MGMKRIGLHLKDALDPEPLERLVAFHQGMNDVVLTYGHLAESKHFTQETLDRCKQVQTYHLINEDATTPNGKDYVLLGLNEKAAMLYFVERGDEAWILNQRSVLTAPRSFHLHWDKDEGFNVEWSAGPKQLV